MILETLTSAQAIIVGILAVIALFAVFLIVFYTIKGILYLAYLAVKLSLKLTLGIAKLGFKILFMPFKISKDKQVMIKTVEIHDEMELEEEAEMEIRFCPNCGERFNTEMESQIHQNGRCFCNHCGNLAQV